MRYFLFVSLFAVACVTPSALNIKVDKTDDGVVVNVCSELNVDFSPDAGSAQ